VAMAVGIGYRIRGSTKSFAGDVGDFHSDRVDRSARRDNPFPHTEAEIFSGE
jgi:hypothetical protein